MSDNKMDNSMMTATSSKIPTTTTTTTNSSGAGKKFPIKLAWLLSMFTLETILENIKKYLTSKTEQPRDVVEEKKSKSDKTPAHDGDQMLENNNTWKEIIEHLSKNNMKLLKPIEKKLIMKKKLKFENQHELMEKISKVCKAQLNDYQFDSLLLLCFHLRKVLDFCPTPNAMLNEMVINLLPCLYSKKIVPKINLITMTKKTLKKKACIILKLLILHPTILKSFNENNELLNNTTTNNCENGTVQKQKRHWDIFPFTKNNKSYDLLSIEERVNSYMKRNQLNNDQLTTETARNNLKQVVQWVMFISKYMEECFEYRFDNEIKLANEKISLTNEQIGIFDKELEFKDEMKNEKKYQNQKVITLNVKAVCSYRRKEQQQHSQQLDKEKKINKLDYVGHVKRLVLFFEKINQKKPY